MALRLLFVLVTIAILLASRYFLRRRGKHFPPGPKGRLLIGNLPDLPQDNAENINTFVKWREAYGTYPLFLYDCFLF